MPNNKSKSGTPGIGLGENIQELHGNSWSYIWRLQDQVPADSSNRTQVGAGFTTCGGEVMFNYSQSQLYVEINIVIYIYRYYI